MNLHKLHLQSAVQNDGGRSNINLDRKCLVTAKIGQILPIFHQECVPGDKFRVNVSNFARFQPLAVPSYVDLTYRTFSVFVPYHQVSDGVESFMSNQKLFKGQNNTIPYFTTSDLASCFIRSDVSSTGSSSNYDFKYNNSYYLFKARGNYFVKLLHLLGYRWTKDFPSDSMRLSFNALPLLSFAHAYNSYLSYSVNYNTSALSSLLETIKRTPSAVFPTNGIWTILSSILLTYEESFLSTCWYNPYYSQPNSSMSNAYKSLTRELDTGETVAPPFVDASVGAQLSMDDIAENSNVLSADQVRLLLKFDKYFRRSNYAGSKDIEQIYSRFGVKIDDYRTRYPYYLNETAQKVSIGDVTSTTDTADGASGAPIGAYAGKAISSGDASFSFDSHDYGMLFVFAWYAPRPLYFKGCDKENLRLVPWDFYNPELDQGFPSFVGRRQVDPEGNFEAYVNLYSEYLYANDIIAGDFERFDSFSAWHFGRMDSADLYAQGDALIYIPQVGSQFERIFNIADPDLVDADTIFMTCDCHCSAVRPMKDFVGKTGLGEGSIDLPALGSQVN